MSQGISANVESQQEALRKRGRSSLTTGQTNLLMIDLIDLMADGKGRRECFAKIKKYYADTLGKDLAQSSYYEIYDRAKSKWITNVNLPSLNNYKKEKLIKSEMLEDDIREGSHKDIVEQAKIIKELWSYQDNLVGLHDETAQDSIHISINMDKMTSISALELDDDMIEVIPQHIVDVTPNPNVDKV